MQAQAKAIILARVSSKAQEDEGYSLDSQLKLMRGYCKNKKLTIVEEFKIAETASKEQRRKVYQEMLAYITKHRVFNVVVEKTDRLTRNFKDATMIDAWLEKDERRMLHLVKENLLLHKEARSDAKFMWNIYLSVAKKYTDNLREEAMKGWAEKLAQGWLPAEPPPGYMTVLENGKKIHVVNPEIYKFIPRVFELALLSGFTRTRLSEQMALMGITTKTGRSLSNSAVTRMLTSPFYIGINRLKGKEYQGAQESIVTKKLFNAVQKKLKSRGYEQKIRKHDPIFKRMITCESCGTTVSWSKQKGRFYGACHRRKDGCWSTHYLREDRVEALILQRLEAVDDPKHRILNKLNALLEIVNPQDVGMYRQKMMSELSSQIARMKTMESNLYDDRLAGYITKEKYEEKRRQFAKQAAEIAKRMAMLSESQNTEVVPAQEVQYDNPIVELYLKSTPHHKRIIMSALFKKIVVKEGGVLILRNKTVSV